MSSEQPKDLSPRMRQAVNELTDMIRGKYPQAELLISHNPEYPEIVHLETIIDVDDTDEVLDVVIDRMMQIQIDEQLPLFVIPMRPAQRALEMMEAQRHRKRPAPQAETAEPTRAAPGAG
jgi:hypothetical protein